MRNKYPKPSVSSGGNILTEIKPLNKTQQKAIFYGKFFEKLAESITTSSSSSSSSSSYSAPKKVSSTKLTTTAPTTFKNDAQVRMPVIKTTGSV